MIGPKKPMEAASPEDQKVYQAIADNYFADTEVRFTLADLANACRLARVDFPTFLRLRAYLPAPNKRHDN